MNKRLLTIIIALMFLVIVATPVTAAQSGYIQIAGITNSCNGGSGLAGYCEINGFQQEVNAMDCPKGGGASSCHANFTLIIGKQLDTSSPKFLEATASQKLLRTVTIQYLQPNSSNSFYIINLTNARVTDDISSFENEQISFNFEKITWKWEPKPLICWDISQNRICTS